MVGIIDFGLKDYKETLDLQTQLFQTLVDEKKEGKEGNEYILIGEHPPVITLGRRAKESNILVNETSLLSKGIKTYHIGRGGDVTYHCPGQMIVYPILDLERHNLGVKDYVNLLEESIIRLLENYGLKSGRVEGASGVWVGKGTKEERKICAIGIKCSRFCTMHGLALNVSSDLSGFSMINPCGFQDKGVTSLQREFEFINMGNAKEIPNISEVKKRFLGIFLGLVFPLEEVLHFAE